MRFQSTFEQVAQGMYPQMFAWCLVALRVVIGLACWYVVWQLLSISTIDTAVPVVANPMGSIDVAAVKSVLVPPLLLLGVVFIFGVFVRPVATIGMIAFVVALVLAGPERWGQLIVLDVIVLFVLALFAAGGSGHALGLDGIIARNIRRPNVVTRFLFG